MFNSITGTLTLKSDDTICVLTGGIEWEIATTSQTVSRLPDIGMTTTVFTFLHHREDQLKLFGFASVRERDLFLNLIKVDSVGPRLALKILSGISAQNLINAVEDGDLDMLICAPGLGRKTAQKIVLTLKGKLVLTEQVKHREYEDIVNALAGMGFDKKDARRAVLEVLKDLKPGSLEHDVFERELLRRSIKLASNTGVAYESRRNNKK
jgi:Holliday junction DNA helicase RuvA